MNFSSEQSFARTGLRTGLVGLSLASALAFAPSVRAATLCVDQHGKPGCVATISAAVAAAHAGDTINVGSGTYREAVVIGTPLSLVGAGRSTTIIDAAGFANGIYVDGMDNSNLQDVVVTGFTVMYANFEGILVNDATSITIWGNTVQQNDKNLQPASEVCPGLPPFETDEAADCGEGIHLIGTSHSIVSNNLVEQNAGGILISDETATSHDNVLERNLVLNNANASGITLASHTAYAMPGVPLKPGALAFGIYNNNLFENDAIHNGFGTPGGAGIALIALAPGTRTYANSITANRITGNFMPGIVIHNGPPNMASSSKNPDASRNGIVGNFIAKNGPDPSVPTTVPTGISILGLSPIIDTTITGNVIEGESIAVLFKSGAGLEAHLNDFGGGTVGIDSMAVGGIVNATENWWGCAGGPGATGCSTATGGTAPAVTPWLTRPVDGAFGHGLDRFFDFLHSYDCDHDHKPYDCDHDFDRH